MFGKYLIILIYFSEEGGSRRKCDARKEKKRDEAD
jgi:hypothetical protein